MGEPQETPEHQTVYDETQSKIVEASKAGVQRPVLVVLDGDNPKMRHTFAEPEISAGRDVSCEIVLSDSKVSRRHARFVYPNFNVEDSVPRVILTDLKSTNGTFVNGKRITEQELHDRDRVLIGSTLFGFFLRDETTLQADETLIKLANYDALTGLLNRGVFDMEITREFERARRYGRPLTLVMLDIDHFKNLNDSYGHQAGDQVLRELGNVIQYNCRKNDVASRYGGEEFAIILPETPLDNSLVQAERLLTSVRSHKFSMESSPLMITVSIGVATITSQMFSPDDLIKAADRALYRAKDEGRDRICWPEEQTDRVTHFEAG